MAGASDGEIIPDVNYKILEKRKEFVNGVLDEIFHSDVDFYLQTLKDLNEQGEVSYMGSTEILKPYVGLSESGARLNFILKLKKAGIVTRKTRREGEAGPYRHTFKIAKNYRQTVEELLEELEL